MLVDASEWVILVLQTGCQDLFSWWITESQPQSMLPTRAKITLEGKWNFKIHKCMFESILYLLTEAKCKFICIFLPNVPCFSVVKDNFLSNKRCEFCDSDINKAEKWVWYNQFPHYTTVQYQTSQSTVLVWCLMVMTVSLNEKGVLKKCILHLLESFIRNKKLNVNENVAKNKLLEVNY